MNASNPFLFFSTLPSLDTPPPLICMSRRVLSSSSSSSSSTFSDEKRDATRRDVTRVEGTNPKERNSCSSRFLTRPKATGRQLNLIPVRGRGDGSFKNVEEGGEGRSTRTGASQPPSFHHPVRNRSTPFPSGKIDRQVEQMECRSLAGNNARCCFLCHATILSLSRISPGRSSAVASLLFPRTKSSRS